MATVTPGQPPHDAFDDYICSSSLFLTSSNLYYANFDCKLYQHYILLFHYDVTITNAYSIQIIENFQDVILKEFSKQMEYLKIVQQYVFYF